MDKIINHPKELVNYFLKASRSKENFKVGAEFEKLGVFARSGKAISYSGREGVATILFELSRRFGWRVIREDEAIVGLSRGSAQITLEPGGQIELSGSTLSDIHQIKYELENHIKEIKSVSEPMGIKWLGLGVQPVSSLEDIQWVPKQRYRIMAPYMAENGELSQHMMKKTASIQVNVDYSDEEDFSEKMRTALVLVPVTTAIFANSPISEGKLNGFLSKRAHIWNYTDPLRCGLIKSEFFSSPRFSSYVNYVLNTPMLFIIREGRWIEVKNITFGQYLRSGYESYKATWDDWELHLSSIFTEVRARGYIEIRNADCQRQKFALAVPALWKGIMYSKEARRQILSLTRNLSWEKLCWLYHTVPRTGLKTKVEGKLLLDFAKEVLKIAFCGLKEQKSLSQKREDETIYLEPFLELITEDEICPAEVIIKNWKGRWRGNIKKLIQYTSY